MRRISLLSFKKPVVVVKKDTVKKYMPQHKKDINKAAENLKGELEAGDTVVLRAVSPQSVHLEIKKPNGKIVTASDTDSRTISALGRKIEQEDEFYNTLGSVPEDQQKLIDAQYKNDLQIIQQTPFDHINGTVNAYRKAVFKPVLV